MATRPTRATVSVGDRIRRLREARSLSQLKLCAISGVSQATLHRAEAGGVVTVRTAQRLAIVLGVGAADLLARR